MVIIVVCAANLFICISQVLLFIKVGKNPFKIYKPGAFKIRLLLEPSFFFFFFFEIIYTEDIGNEKRWNGKTILTIPTLTKRPNICKILVRLINRRFTH